MADTQQITLADFLLARIAEDEAAARDDYFEFDDVDDGGLFGEGSSIFMTIGRRRVLVDLEAKRRIVALHADGNADNRWDGDPDPLPAFCTCCHDRNTHQQEPWPCEMLRLLALPYADAPGYRDEWRP